MTKHFFFIFTLLSLNLVFGQDRDAKLILKNTKCIEGFGEIKNNKIYFRLTLDEKPEVWTEDDAYGLEFVGHYIPEKYVYVFHGKKNEVHLMEVIEIGSVELYKDTFYLAYFSSTGNNLNTTLSAPTSSLNSFKNIEYYIKKQNDVKGIKVTMDFKKIGKTFFSDCQDLMEIINEEEFFEEEEIIDLVKFYNANCGE